MDRYTTAHAYAPAPSQTLTAQLLAALDNYAPDDYDQTSVARSLACLRESGWMGRVLDADYSVPGHTEREAARTTLARQLDLMHEVGRGSLPLGRIFEGHVNALELVNRFGDAKQRERWHAAAHEGNLFGVWNTEMRDGVHIRPRPGGGYVLEGAKSFCSGAPDLAHPIITGHLWDEERVTGWQMVVLPMELVNEERVDRSFWSPLGMEASASYKVDFSGIEIGEEHLLGKPDDYHAQPHFSGGAIRFAAVQLGGARALYDHTVAMLASMHRTHDPYQSHRIARMAIALQTGRQWLDAASEQALPGFAEDAEVIHFANMTRCAILECCNTVLELCEQAVGARGFLQPKPIQRIYTDLKMYLRQPGPDNALAAVGHHAVATYRSPLSGDQLPVT